VLMTIEPLAAAGRRALPGGGKGGVYPVLVVVTRCDAAAGAAGDGARAMFSNLERNEAMETGFSSSLSGGWDTMVG
jgi:hypothetical protein